jgi:hypothetical protein
VVFAEGSLVVVEVGVGVGVGVEDVGSARATTTPTDRGVNPTMLAEATATAVARAMQTRRNPGVRFLAVPPDSVRAGAMSAASRPADRTSRVVDYSTLGSHPLDARPVLMHPPLQPCVAASRRPHGAPAHLVEPARAIFYTT